jgi:hypothetical protein
MHRHLHTVIIAPLTATLRICPSRVVDIPFSVWDS